MSGPFACVAGLGCRADVSVEALRALFARLAQGRRIDAIATLGERAELPAMRAMAREAGLPLVAITREAIAGIATPTRSARILATFATGSVAEAVALAAIGPQARIAIPRQTSTDGSASAAIAFRDRP